MKKIYFPDDPQIQIHQSRVQMCPELFPQGFYWYGKRKHGPGCPSKKVQKKINANLEQSLSNADSQPSEITFTETKTASTETTAVADDNQLVNLTINRQISVMIHPLCPLHL